MLTQAPPITGIVRGPDGQPLVGVNVLIKGTKKGTVTEENGKFTLDAESGNILVISNTGYQSKEITLKGQEILTIDLAISNSVLDEVQIIAYGTSSQRFQTGNIASLKAEDIENQPVNNPLAALIARLPGLFITQNSGVPGAGFNIKIRGTNSIANGNDPLYIIDGVPYTQQLLPNSGASILHSSNTSPSEATL